MGPFASAAYAAVQRRHHASHFRASSMSTSKTFNQNGHSLCLVPHEKGAAGPCRALWLPDKELPALGNYPQHSVDIREESHETISIFSQVIEALAKQQIVARPIAS